MKKDTVSTGAFWIGTLGAFAALRRINKYVRPVNHNPIADLAILGVEVVVSVTVGACCSFAADTVVNRYEKRKAEKKEEEKKNDWEDVFDECEPEDAKDDGIHFTVINTETDEEEEVNETPVDPPVTFNEESDIFKLGWHPTDLTDAYKKGSEVDGDI